jgi:hypothetical protein
MFIPENTKKGIKGKVSQASGVVRFCFRCSGMNFFTTA